MATQEVPVIPHTLPAGYCFTTLQDLLDTFSAHQTVELPEGSTQIIVSESTPIPADQDKVWLKLDGSGDPVNFYWFNGGSWVEVNPPSVFWGIGSNVVDAYTVAVANPPPALVTGQLYLFKVPAANTGAATLQVNAFGAFPFNAAGTALTTGQLVANSYIGVIWTGTTFELLGGISTFPVSKLIPGPDSSHVATVAGVATWIGRITLTPLTLDPAPSTPGANLVGAHGLGARPNRLTGHLICDDAGGDVGYAFGDVLQLLAVQAGSAGQYLPYIALKATATNVYAQVPVNTNIWTSNATTGAPIETLTPSKWKLEVVAEIVS